MHTRNGVDICGSQRNPAAIDRKGFVVKKNSVDIWYGLVSKDVGSIGFP